MLLDPLQGGQAPDTRAAPAPGRFFDEESGAASVVVDEDGIVIEATSGAAAMLGFAAGELVGRGLQELAAEGWSWAVENSLLRLASGSDAAFDLMLAGRSGRRALVQMIPHPWSRPGETTAHLLVWLEQEGAAEAPPAGEAEARLRRLAYGLLKSQERERGRVVAELHDGVAPLVTMAKFMVENAVAGLARGTAQEATALLMNTVEQLREALAIMRRISNELRPSSLDDLGLLPTLQGYCRDFAEDYPGLRIALDLSAGEAAVAQDLKIDIFRVVQEALINVGRHAHATQVSVALVHAEGGLHLSVRDDGIGFDVAPFLRGDACGGLGLHSIRKRVEATGGALLLRSAPWQGTTVGASWALPEGAARA